MRRDEASYDVLIVGGGPAGLSAALVLGRCRRRVAVVDASGDHPRGAASFASHGFFTRDGESSGDLIRIGREQLAPYDVSFLQDDVTAVVRTKLGGGWLVQTRSGRALFGKKAIVAVGVPERLPDLPGVAELLGRGVFVCPTCDGWEFRDQPFGAYGWAQGAVDFALELLTWSSDVVLFTDGRALPSYERARLERNGVVVCERPVEALERIEDRLEAVRLVGDVRIPRRALFVHLGPDHGASFVRDLRRVAPSDGLRVTGDESPEQELIAVAVAEGVRAARAIHSELSREDHR